MKPYKLLVFFIAVILSSNVFFPLGVFADPHRDENSHKEKRESLKSENYNIHKSHSNEKSNDDKKPDEQKKDHSDQNNSNTQVANSNIPQSGPDEGDNKHPSGKDRSEEHGRSETQGKSQSDPDGLQNVNGGTSGKDKIGYDGGLDKHDQDNNNGCGNDDDFEDDNNGNCKGHNHNKDNKINPPQKNPGDCDVNGSAGDKNGRPCNPGKNNASPTGCLHGEPDCDRKGGAGGKNDEPKKQDEQKQKNESSSSSNAGINIIAVNISVSNQQSSQPASQVLGASTLAATGDFLLRVGFALISTGGSLFIFGLFFLGKRAFNKVFNSGFQPYLYLYEA